MNNLIYSNGLPFDIILTRLFDKITSSERNPEGIKYKREIAADFLEITNSSFKRN